MRASTVASSLALALMGFGALNAQDDGQAVPASTSRSGGAVVGQGTLVAVPIMQSLTDDHSILAIGNASVGPAVRLQAPFEGIPGGTLVRPIAYEVKYLQRGFYLGGSQGLWYRGEQDCTPIGISGTVTLRKDGIPTDERRFVHFELVPVSDDGWGKVARSEDVVADMAMSDYQAPRFEHPTPGKPSQK